MDRTDLVGKRTICSSQIIQ